MTSSVEQQIRAFLHRVLSLAPDVSVRWTQLAGDGSTRTILRLMPPLLPGVLIVNRLPAGRARPDENDAFLAAHEFLAGRAVPVPAIYAADLQAGFLLVEDLGDTRLHEHAHDRADTSDIHALYQEAIRHLARMQASAGPDFDPARTHNPAYTPTFIVESEARYFHDEFYAGFAHHEPDFARIAEECCRLAHDAVHPDRRSVFLHRDYQSRNLMVVKNRVVVIDFQGARLGPPEYDLAALLYDPYVPLLDELRERLLADYLRVAAARVPGVPSAASQADLIAWRRIFLANCANRLMQALGAFAKLGGRERRPGFVEHIPTGLARLRAVLIERADCPALLEMVQRCEDFVAR